MEAWMEKGRQENNVLTQSTDAYFVLYFHAQFDELDPERHRLLDLKLDHGFRMQSTRGIYIYVYFLSRRCGCLILAMKGKVH